MTQHPQNGFPFFRGEGFSLIEVLLAIGLVTFSLLVIFSLMPAGMSALQDANRQIVETEIFNALGAEMASTPFNALTNYTTNFPAYFDYEGNKTTAANAVFTVRCNLQAPELGSGELCRAALLVGYHMDPAQTNATAPKPSKRTLLLVNSGT